MCDYEDYAITSEGLMDVQAMEEMNWFVTRDGSTISPGMASENDAHRWLQKHQPMSNDWAMKYEGYGIREHKGEEPAHGSMFTF